MSLKESSMKNHVVLNILPLLAIGIAFIGYHIDIFDLPVIGPFLLFVVIVINIPNVVVLIAAMLVEYFVLLPFVMYYLYVIVKFIYNAIYLKNSINLLYMLVISICMVVTIVIIIYGVEEAITIRQTIMSV